MIKQASAGIYSWLPLGFKVLQKIEQIVHEEQARAGHMAMLMPTIQSADLWRESGRYDAYGAEMLRIKDRHDRDMLFTPTAEELITDIFRAHVTSYKDLPLTMYQIQWKFRDEIRPRFGVMRGREFYMKDGYNFDLTKEDALHAYNRHLVSYLRTYERMGLQAIPMRADSGPIGGDDTHEFLVLAETGESEVFYDSEITDLRFGDRDIDYDSHAAVPGGAGGVHLALCPHRRDPRPEVFAQIPEERQPGRARHRGRPDLLFRDQVFRGDGRACHRP
jgi:prolyl-tRNA synthetase